MALLQAGPVQKTLRALYNFHMSFFVSGFLLVLAMGLARPAFADYTPWKHYREGTVDAFKGENKWIWVSGIVLTGAAFIWDQDIEQHYAHTKEFGFANNIGDVMGTGIPGSGLALLTMGTGMLFKDSDVLGAGVAHAEAIIATCLYTSILKVTVQRSRPDAFMEQGKKNGKWNYSFPSGHTSTAFATAGSLMASGVAWVGVPMLVMAGLTGFSRVQQRAHYLGDVIFGATLGYTMGVGYYKHHKPAAASETTSWNVWPVFEDRENFGVVVSHNF